MPIIRIGIGTHILQQVRALSLAETLVNAFIERVEADGGTVESKACIIADVEALDLDLQPVVVPEFTGLLDAYSGAAAAYSLRQLDSTYSGNAVRVRRASDNTEQDIGFVNNVLDTSTLESFCSGTDGFVTTWYDQSGSNNATQTTAARQPKIVNAGTTLVDSNSNPYLSYDDSDDSLLLGSEIATSDSFRHFIVCDNDSDGRVYDSNADQDSVLIQSYRYIVRVNNNNTVVNVSGGRNKNIIQIGRNSSDEVDFVVNNSSLLSGTTITGESGLLEIGSAGSLYGGAIYELITYNGDSIISSLDSNGVRDNMNTNYNTF